MTAGTLAPLLAGVGRALVTPPVGTRLSGTLREDVSREVERDLTVTTLVLSNSEATIAIIACDIILLSLGEASELRGEVGRRIGVPPEHVFLNVSHSHATPAPPSYRECEDSEDSDEVRHASAYYENFRAQVAGTAEVAAARRQPARIGSGVGEVRVGVNRREVRPDGTMVLGENPNGIVDPSVGVLRVDSLAGCTLAVVMSYACHPDVLGPKCSLISPDFVGSARAVVESLTGGKALFLQGAAGDIDPRCGIVLGADGTAEADRIGTELGCEVVRVCQNINTARRRDRRLEWHSTDSIVTGWQYAEAEPADVPLAVATRRLTMPLRPFPSLAVARAQVEKYENELARANSGADRVSSQVAHRRLAWARRQLAAIANDEAPAVELELQVMRVGDTGLVGVQGELFVEIGLAVKAASPFSPTLVCGYTNGMYFYIPTAAAFKQGGYEVESYRNYLQPAGPTAAWEGILVRELGELLASLR